MRPMNELWMARRLDLASRIGVSVCVLALLVAAGCGCEQRPGGTTPVLIGSGDADGIDPGGVDPGNDNSSGGDIVNDPTAPPLAPLAPEPELKCITCHNLALGKRRAVVDADGGGGHHVRGTALTNADCVLCHEVTQHLAGVVRLWEDPTVRTTAFELTADPSTSFDQADQLTPFCQSCHIGGGQMPHPGGGNEHGCIMCHDIHDPSMVNQSLIAHSVYNAAIGQEVTVRFTARTGLGSFDDGDPAALDGVCQVCHTATAHHRFDGSAAPHNDGVDCTACHSHQSGFAPLGVADASCLDCHSVTQGSRPAVVDAQGRGGHHFQATAMTSADCETCHEMTQHQQGAIRLWQDPNSPSAVITLTGDPGTEQIEADLLTPFCASCHAMDQQAVHIGNGIWQPACTQCHDMHNPADVNLSLINTVVHSQTLGLDLPVSFTSRTGLGSLDDGDPAANNGLCQVCHTATAHHLYDGSAAPHNDAMNCTQCHSHASGFAPLGVAELSCMDCHSEPQGARPAVVDAQGGGGHHLQTTLMTSADCETCHEMTQHQAGLVRLWADPNQPSSVITLNGDPSTVVAEAEKLTPFCWSCHAEIDHGVHAVSGAWQPTCMACHDMHDRTDSNLNVISTLVRNQTLGVDQSVVFTARTGSGSFDDGDPAQNNGICQVCHTTTNHHLFDGSSLAHNDGTDCTACHSHGSGFAPLGVGDLSCTECHNTVQGSRRAIADEFTYASHHVSGSVTDADCEACHDQTQHMGGQVRLKSADDPGNPNAVVTLTGDPMSSFDEATKLEAFCLACHDGDGASGSAPFADGIMPSTINANLWSQATHNSMQTTCVGDGETFGCHSTGHGSFKATLLAPWDAAQTPVAGDPLREQEGMCYGCHDANGPAATDIESIFALATHHNVSAVDQADGSRVECVSCHNPHEVSAASKLRNPNGGEPWTGTGEAFCQSCHGGVAPAGIAFPPVAPGTGFDKSTFTGTTHDSETGTDSCRQCHDQHGSSFPSMLRADYVVADQNGYAAADYGACWNCHDVNAIIFGTNQFEDLHKKHVKDERGPCIICHDVHRGFDPGEPGLIDMDYPIRAGGYNISFLNGVDGSSSFWIEAGQNRGNCTIKCHGQNHTPKKYDRL